MAKPGFFLDEIMDQDGEIQPSRFAAGLRITQSELAAASGLSKDALSRCSRRKGPSTQGRLKEIAEIINTVLPWAGSGPRAFFWYRAQPLPSFGDQTAEDLVKEGRGETVMAYLVRIAAGGYA